MTECDVVIVGGGPAGLSAATVLARARRRVIVLDAGNQRNVRSQAMHGFLSREGIRPSEFLAVVHQQIAAYGVEIRSATATRISREEKTFRVDTLDEEFYCCRRILLATGVVDKIPDLQGFRDLYGVSIHHCPYCDGWEHAGEPIAVYGRGSGTANMALAMLNWSPDIVVVTDGPAQMRGSDKKRLQRRNIQVYELPIQRLDGSNGRLEQIVFQDGSSIRRSAMFFNTGNEQRSELAASAGCRIDEKGAVVASRDQCSTVPGIYVAGDAARDAQFVIIAAAHGAKAAMVINRELQKEDLES